MDVLERIADHLRKKEVVVLTGAGMSTASGLPGFAVTKGYGKTVILDNWLR